MLLIRGGHIKPIVGEELMKGDVLVGDDGRIAAIGENVDVPADTPVLDATAVWSRPALWTRIAISAWKKNVCAGRAMT